MGGFSACLRRRHHIKTPLPRARNLRRTFFILQLALQRARALGVDRPWYRSWRVQGGRPRHSAPPPLSMLLFLERIHLPRDAGPVVSVCGRKVGDGTSLNEILCRHQVPGYVARQPVARALVQHLPVKAARLCEVVVVRCVVPGHVPNADLKGEAKREEEGASREKGRLAAWVRAYGRSVWTKGGLVGAWWAHGEGEVREALTSRWRAWLASSAGPEKELGK